MVALALVLVAVVGLAHGAAFLGAARLLGHDVRRPWQLLIPGWGAARTARTGGRARVLVFVAGLVATYLAIATLAFVGLEAYGMRNRTGRWEVRNTAPGGPADGLLVSGDVIDRINDQPVVAPHQPIGSIIDAGGGSTVRVDVVRAGEPHAVEIRPRLDGASGGYRIGVELGIEATRTFPPVLESAARALTQPAVEVRRLFADAWPDDGADPGGPVMITQVFTRVFEPSGLLVIQQAIVWSTQLALLLVLIDLIAGLVGAMKRRGPP